MSKTFTQSKSTYKRDESASSTLTAFDSNPTTGRNIVVLIHGYHEYGYDVSSVTDTKSNTYTRVVASGLDQGGSRRRTLIYAAYGITGGTGFTITVNHYNATVNSFHATAIEFAATGAVTADKSGSDTEAYEIDSITATGSGANADSAAFVVGIAGWSNNATEIVGTPPSSPWVTLVSSNSSGDYELNGNVSYKIASGTETSAYTVTVDDTDVVLVAAVASFKETTTAKYLKLLAHSSAASATGVEGVVLNSTRDTVIGEFTGQAFEASLEGSPGEAVLLIDLADIDPDGDTLTTSDTPIVFAYNSTDGTVGEGSATVIEV